ncbi:hypothetical protein APTSU1_001351100 [Apodemus speciosus]|uniref:SPATA31 domain-containing protein n=1 Tax=Apodemus speciosus TaxID=105296 RepID=A0ABQ0FGA4_APOSI
MSLQPLEEETKRDDTSPDPKRSGCQLTAPGDLPGLAVTDPDTQVPKINLKLKGKRKQFGTSDQLLCVKIPEGDLSQKHSQLFWGLPSLHSESIVATLLVPVSSYSPDPRLVLFNGVCRAAAAPVLSHGLPALPQPQPLPLALVHPQPFPKVAPQPQALTEGKSQAHMQSPLPAMALPSLPCGSALQIPQTRTVSDVLNGKEPLRYHLLQNPQGGLWGLVPECQRYETAFGLPVHSFPLGGQPPQTYVSIPGSGLFHLSSEHQNNLDPYGPNTLISPWCFQPCNRTGVPEVMDAQLVPSGVSSHCYKYATPQCCVHWGNLCAEPRSGEPGHSESYCVKPQLRKDVAKNLGQILGKSPLDNPQVISGCYILNSLKAVPETEDGCACHSQTGLENGQLSISRKNSDQRHTRSILRLHVSRKYWQITMGRIPIEVCCSWLAEDASLLSAPLGKICCNTAIPEIPLLDRKTQKMLEAHLIRFRVSQQWGLPIKVMESIKFYILREAKTWPLPQSEIPLPLNSIPGLDLKSNFASPLRGRSSNLLHGDKLESTDSAHSTDHSLSLLHADTEGEEALSQSASSPVSDVSETVQTVEDDRPSNPDVSQNEAMLQSRPRQEQPIKEEVARSEPECEIPSSSAHLVTAENKQSVENHPKYLVTPNMLREILKAREMSVLLSGSDSSIKSESSAKQDEDESKSGSAVDTEQDPSRMSVPEEPPELHFKKQLLKELRSKLETQPQCQSEGLETESSFASDSFSSYSSSSSNSAPSADISIFRDIQGHIDSTGISADLWQEPGVFKRILKNFAPAEKRRALPFSRKENGRNDPQELETSEAGKKSQPIKEKSDKKEHPPDSYFRKKIGQFFQWLYSSKDSTRHRSEKDRALFLSCGPPEAHELMASLGKLLEDKLLCGQKSEFLEWSQKRTLPAHPELKGRPPNLGAVNEHHGEATRNCFCPQTAITPGPSRKLTLGRRRQHISFEHPSSTPESLNSVQAPLA